MRNSIAHRGALTGAVIVIALLATTALGDTARVRYDGHHLVRANITSEAELATMMDISPDCWCEQPHVGTLHFRVPPENIPWLELSGIDYVVLSEDIQVRVDAEQDRLEAGAGDGAWYSDFKPFDEIVTRLNQLAAAHPGLAEVLDIGDSLQGRDILALRMTAGTSERPGVLFNACQHAREWISPMTAMFIAEAMLDGYGSDPTITELLDTTEFFVIPIVNPDGYVYSWASDRYWRKNRRNNGGGTFGVDTNRNWAFGWGGGGSSSNPNDPTYRGTGPFSEPETQVMRDFYLAHPNVVASIDFHSFGQWVLYPWAYRSGGPGDDGEHATIGVAMADAIFAVHGRDYVDGPVFETLYQASGGSVDWTWGDQRVISYTIELRGNDFVIDPGQIVPTGEENLEAALTIASFADELSAAVRWEFQEGLPEVVDAGEVTAILMDVYPGTSGPIDMTSGVLAARIAGNTEFIESPLVPLGGTLLKATLPAASCGEIIEYYFTIDAETGSTYTSPTDAPTTLYAATATEITVAFEDDFESDLGWTVESENLTDGAWERGVPAGDGTRGDPLVDGDGSGSCFLTDNQAGNSDVDGGPTRMISPTFDLSGTSDPYARYTLWFSNDDDDEDRLDVEISSNGGATWAPVESVGNTNGWVAREVRISDFAAVTDAVVLRFSATDNPNNSVTEAGVDAVVVFESSCPGGGPGDVNGDGVVDFLDILQVLAAWGPCPGCPEDLDGSGIVDFGDVLIILSNWS